MEMFSKEWQAFLGEKNSAGVNTTGVLTSLGVQRLRIRLSMQTEDTGLTLVWKIPQAVRTKQAHTSPLLKPARLSLGSAAREATAMISL